MVFGERRTNVLFDVAIPYDTELSRDEIKSMLEKKVTEADEKFCPIVTIEYCI